MSPDPTTLLTLFCGLELLPALGSSITTVLLPQPQVNSAVLFGDDYMFPRCDGVLLGGTHEREVWTFDPKPKSQTACAIRASEVLFGNQWVSTG